MQTHHFFALVFSALAVLVPASHANAGTEAQATATVRTPGAPGAPGANGFHRIASKKGGSGVDLAYKVDGTPEVGKPVVVKLQISSLADAQVTVRTESGLQLSSAELVMRSAAGVSSEHQMSVTPLATGRHYLFVTSIASGRTSSSAIAVQVGKDAPQAKPRADVIVMPGGERVISMPAQ